MACYQELHISEKAFQDETNQQTDRLKEWQSFNSVLNDNEKRETFKEFLSKEHSEENLMFWTSCQQFKRVPNKPTAIRFYARAIYNEFIAESAKSEVNIAQSRQKEIKLRMSSPTIDMFDDAMMEIENLMKNDSFQRFLNYLKQNTHVM